MAETTEESPFNDVFDQLFKGTKGWQVVRNVTPLYMISLLACGYLKSVQLTSVENVYQVRLTAKGRDYAKH